MTCALQTRGLNEKPSKWEYLALTWLKFGEYEMNELAMEVKKGDGDLLRLAQRKMHKKGIDDVDFRRFLSDKSGTYGVLYKDMVIVAKSYINNGIVSCHSKVIDLAKQFDVRIIMYVDSMNRCYSFKVSDIEKDCVKNIRNGEWMVNWNIRIGEAI